MYLHENGIELGFFSQTIAMSLQNILKKNLESVTVAIMPHQEVKLPPLGHYQPRNALPGVENAHAVVGEHEAGVEDAILKAVEGAEDDVFGGIGEAEEVGVDEQLLKVGEREGAGLGVEGLELDAAGAAGLPVGVVGEDFEGEDGGRTHLGFEEVEEVLGGGGARNVEDANCVRKRCCCRPHGDDEDAT